MKLIIQRVKSAEIVIDEKETRCIGKGLFILIGVEDGEDGENAAMLAKKCAEMRIFEDADEKMNLSAQELKLDALVVSNFTLYADIKKGRRPSFIAAAKPEAAKEVYEKFLGEMQRQGLNKVESGEFGAYMQITPVCDGPVTIIADPAQW